MVQLSVAMSPKPISRKQKIIAACSVVVVAHVGVLWGLSHMQPMQLVPANPPKPVKVRFIELPKQEMPKPPAPVEPVKPKEVKVVDTPPPPKKVEKIQQVKKEKPKPKVVEAPKPVAVEAPVVSTVVSEVVTPKPVVKPAPEPTPQPVPQPAAPTVDPSPRNLGDAASVAWKRKPKPKIDQQDLAKVTESVVILRIDVDEKGKIKARVVQSSGNPKVDREMLRAVQAAQFYPYTEKGVAVPFYAEQPFRIQ